MGEFERFTLDQLLAIAQANRPAAMETEAQGWDATAWLLEAQLQRLEAAVARLRTIWDSPAADRFVGEIAKVRDTLASGQEKAAGNARSWRVIAARNGRLVDELAELSLSRHNARTEVKAKYDQEMSRHEENFGWAGGLGDLLAPDPPNYGLVDNRADAQARQIMTTADRDFTAEYRTNLWEPPKYQGPVDTSPAFSDTHHGARGSGSGSSSGIGVAPRGGGLPGTAQPLPDGAAGPPEGLPALPGDGPVLAGPPAAPPAPLPVAPPALPPVGAGPGGPSLGPLPAVPPFLPPGGGVVPPGGIRPVPPGRAPLIPPMPPSSPPVTGGRPLPPGGRPPVVPPGSSSVVGRGPGAAGRPPVMPPGITSGGRGPGAAGRPPVGGPVAGGAGGRPPGAAPARRIVADPVTGRPAPTGTARPTATGRGPGNPGVLGQRDLQAGRGSAGSAAGSGGARPGRRREHDDRDPDVAAAENDLWFVDDDLPAVIEPADRPDPGVEDVGPHVGGGRPV